MNPALDRIFSRRLIICLGPGGVGKTTVSAALGVAAARHGLAADLMTIDPAPRLLDALGLDAGSCELQAVRASGSRRNGRLRALRLDPKHTFDRLVESRAPSPEARDTILNNRIYRNLSTALAGVAHYMAVERLLELHDDDSLDVVVLDTPPAREALDFLDAPGRLLDLLNSRALSLLGSPGGILSMADVASRAILAAFDRITGMRILNELRTFVGDFEGMYQGFAERAERARTLMRADSTHAILITTAEPERVGQIEPFITGLAAAGITVGAVVANRIGFDLPECASLGPNGLEPPLRQKLAHNLRDFRALKRREDAAFDALRRIVAPGTAVIAAPELIDEPRSLKALADFAASLVERD
jgi:anion-transporting  ArsA/GET3 family ATPase